MNREALASRSPERSEGNEGWAIVSGNNVESEFNNRERGVAETLNS